MIFITLKMWVKSYWKKTQFISMIFYTVSSTTNSDIISSLFPMGPLLPCKKSYFTTKQYYWFTRTGTLQAIKVFVNL